MGARDMPFSCQCGQVQGHLRAASASCGTAIQCHCDDCRRALIWLGQPDPGPDGVRYFQTTPDRIDLDGTSLCAFTWKNKRLLRWYAPCCNTAMFNTLDSPKWAFVTIHAANLDSPDSLGPVKSHAFVEGKDGKRRHKNALAFMLGFAKRITAARLTGSWRKTPFFAPDGSSTGTVHALTRAQRQSAQL